MKQQTMYRYLGVNGVIDSPVLLEGIYSVKTVVLTADDGCSLTKDGITFVNSVQIEATVFAVIKANLINLCFIKLRYN